MNSVLEVVQPGIGTTVQDRGRPGHRHQGLPLCGWLDAPLAEAANALIGNPVGAACFELRGAGTVLQVLQGPVRVALAGCVAATLSRSDGARSTLPAWHSGSA